MKNALKKIDRELKEDFETFMTLVTNLQIVNILYKEITYSYKCLLKTVSSILNKANNNNLLTFSKNVEGCKRGLEKRVVIGNIYIPKLVNINNKSKKNHNIKTYRTGCGCSSTDQENLFNYKKRNKESEESEESESDMYFKNRNSCTSCSRFNYKMN